MRKPLATAAFSFGALTMAKQIRKVVILGGGSAGWLTAGILAAEHKLKSNPSLNITLVESPDVRTIGVGEGTWPSMRDTLRRMGVSETDFITECDASFKQASKFVGWVTGAPDDFYYHPFSPPQGYGDTNLVPAWAELNGSARFADVVSFQPQLCEHGRAPKQNVTPEFAAVANYAYHLDAGKFGKFMQKFCVEQLGVRHILTHVEGVESTDNGDIAALRTGDDRIEGDLFIDCTGFSSILMTRHFEIPRAETRDVLFCDTALAVQVPYPGADTPITSHTVATAREAGWVWDMRRASRACFAELRWCAGGIAAGKSAQDSDQPGPPGDILASQLRCGRHISRFHRTARGIGPGFNRDVGPDDRRRTARDAAADGRRGGPFQRPFQLPLGPDSRFSQTALPVEQARGFRILDR
jgi:hypothetical protein